MTRILPVQVFIRSATFIALVALVVAGFVHSIHRAPTKIDPAITAYLTSGGSLGDICTTGGDGDNEPNFTFGCDACLIKNGLIFSYGSKIARPEGCARLVLDLLQCDRVAVTHEFDLARACRAPPFA